MASTPTSGKKLVLFLQQHPGHEHPLQLLDSTNESFAPNCRLCFRMISRTAQAYACQERCETFSYYHRLCVEAPPQIDLHPLHPAHPLPLIHDHRAFTCECCGEAFDSGGSSFCCDECNFDLDIACALSTLSDEGRHQGGKTPDRITLSLHPHQLTSFSQRHDFVKNSDCYICKGRVEEDGYICLLRPCEFVIHKECIQDQYYADGTKAPRVYHGHSLVTFLEKDTGSRTCASCGSEKVGEFIGCETCQVFYHRTCFQVPGILQYPSHRPDHTLVLFSDIGTWKPCESCSYHFADKIYYRCTSCEFFLHVGCASKVLAYCEEGMSAKIELSWHNHPLLLCHRIKSIWRGCSYCEDESIGPTYVCHDKDCRFQLHKRCTEIKSTITHPHHPYHPLNLGKRDDDDVDVYCCNACFGEKFGLRFSCKLCSIKLDVKCAARFPTHKHYLHQHKLLCFEKYRNMECNRCETMNDLPIFRCVPCNFNLHEECMELPRVIKNDKIHWHPLTLHEIFVEDDTGEYYCEHCEKTRDPRLGTYVCEYCEISLPRIYHIHCVIPELGKLYEMRYSYAFKELNKQIEVKKEEIQAIEERLKKETQNLVEATREFDKLMKERTSILDGNS